MLHYWPAILRLSIAIATLLALPFLEGVRFRQDLPFNVVGILSLYPLVYGAYGFYLTFWKKLIPPFKTSFSQSDTYIDHFGEEKTTTPIPMWFMNWAIPFSTRMILSLLWPVIDILLQVGFLVSALLQKMRTGQLPVEREGNWDVSARGIAGLFLLASVIILIWGKGFGFSTAKARNVLPNLANTPPQPTQPQQPVPAVENAGANLPAPADAVPPQQPALNPPNQPPPPALTQRQEWSGKLQLLKQNRKTRNMERSPDWTDITLRIPKSTGPFEGELSFRSLGVVAHVHGTRTDSTVTFLMDSVVSGPAASVAVPSSFSGRFDSAGVLRGTWTVGDSPAKNSDSPGFWVRPPDANAE